MDTANIFSQAADAQPPSTISTIVKKSSLKQILAKFGLDMLPVIAGILIALFVNKMQQNAQDRKLLETTLQALSAEFKDNESEINKNLPRHLRLLDSLKKYKADGNYCLYDILSKTNLSTGNIFTTHWQTTLSTNSLRFLNFNTVKLLSQIDAQHQEMRKQEEMLYPIVFGPPMYKKGQEGKEYMQVLEGWLISFKSNEQQLVNLYAEFSMIVQEQKFRQESN